MEHPSSDTSDPAKIKIRIIYQGLTVVHNVRTVAQWSACKYSSISTWKRPQHCFNLDLASEALSMWHTTHVQAWERHSSLAFPAWQLFGHHNASPIQWDLRCSKNLQGFDFMWGWYTIMLYWVKICLAGGGSKQQACPRAQAGSQGQRTSSRDEHRRLQVLSWMVEQLQETSQPTQGRSRKLWHKGRCRVVSQSERADDSYASGPWACCTHGSRSSWTWTKQEAEAWWSNCHCWAAQCRQGGHGTSCESILQVKK